MSKPINCYCIPGARVEFCPVHVSGEKPIYEGTPEAVEWMESQRVKADEFFAANKDRRFIVEASKK